MYIIEDKDKRKEESVMSMTSDMLRGNTETIILAHLLEKDSYGYQINKDILTKTNNLYELKEATLYSAFRRLEQEGKIKSYWGNEDSNARRRYYAITEIGKLAYEKQKEEWKLTKSIIDKLIK